MRTKRFILDVEGQIELSDMTLLLVQLEKIVEAKKHKLKNVKITQGTVMGEELSGVIK